MTHDELLAQINFCDQSSISFDGVNSRLGYALRTVVELHKPYVVEHYWADGLETKAQSFCTVCVGEVKSDSIFRSDVAIPVYYPCDTIRAIEKELA